MSDEDKGTTQDRTPAEAEAPTPEGAHAPAPPQPASAAPVPSDAPAGTGIRRGGTVVGIVLVCVGLVMLFGGYVPWFDLFRLWPLIIVAGGLVEMFRSRREPALKRIAEGAGSVAVGLVLLGNTFGYISWSVWITMLSLWPLLLVAIGIELLGRGLRLTWVRALSNVVLLLGLLYGVFVLPPGRLGVALLVPGVTRVAPAFQDQRPHDPAVTAGTATIKLGATYLTVGAGSGLVSISGKAPTDAPPTLSATVASGTAVVSVEDPSGRTVVLGVQDRSLDLALDDTVTWKDLELDLGAVQGTADLRKLKVEQVSVNAGASDVTIVVGSRSPDVAVHVSGGVTNVTVRVPAGAAVTLDAASGLSNVNVPLGYRHLGGIPFIGDSSWESAGSGGPRVALTLQSGVSNFSVETY